MDRPVEKARGLSRRGVVLLAVAVLAAGALALSLPSLRRWAGSERSFDASQLRIGVVVRGDLQRDVSAQGRVVAALHPTLFANSSGIVSLRVKAGESVKKGQTLAAIESPELKSLLEQGRSTLLSLKSDLLKQEISARQDRLRSVQTIELLTVKLAAAKRGQERAERTFAEGLINKGDYEKAQDDFQIAGLELKNARESGELLKETLETELQNKKLQVEREEAAGRELQRKVTELSIVAPFDGIVAAVNVQDRDAVPANQSILTVVNLSQFEVEVSIAENDATEVAPGTRALVLYENRELEGRVTAISPQVSDSQVKGTVVFSGEAPANLRQNLRVQTRLVFESKPDVLKAPRGPFLESGGGRRAYVVENGIASLREIETGAVSVSEVEIVKGLAAGDRIVVSDTTDFQGARTVLLR